MVRQGMGGRRGAAGQQYAIVVGLIAVVAIVSITTVGRQTSNLFTNVSNRLSNIGDTGASATGSDPAQTCANGSTPIARIFRGAQEYWLCRGIRGYTAPASALTTCPTSGWNGTSFQSFDGSVTYGAFRYEPTNVNATGITTTTSIFNYTCADGACTSAGGGGNSTTTVTRSYAVNVDTCAVSLDGYNIATGTTAYTAYAGGGGVDQTDFTFGAMGGTGVRNWGARPMASMYFLRGQNSLSFTSVNLASEKIWLQTRP